MKDLEKSNYLVAMYEIYGKLLTKKQVEYFELYFFDDYSLSEIADQFGVSRNAVYDSLLKITNTLNKFDTSLQIFYKQSEREKIYQEFEGDKNCQKLIARLKAIDIE